MKKVILTIGVLSLLVIIGYQNKKYKELNDKHKQLEVLVEEDTSALDFGELFQARRLLSATSDGNRAVFGGGYDGSSNVNTMDYKPLLTLNKLSSPRKKSGLKTTIYR